ncbi:methyltransferase family protein [Aspergillus lucknowensis]|uniref:Protein-S-isoprenylcysteine O-methyltransferase n=1 Tax=Aspergillus lucknowensis TaxID=176173 RepID=A0ABR4LFF1_9EURO
MASHGPFTRTASHLSRPHDPLTQSGGFSESFDTEPTWEFTFFAPSNETFAYGACKTADKSRWLGKNPDLRPWISLNPPLYPPFPTSHSPPPSSYQPTSSAAPSKDPPQENNSRTDFLFATGYWLSPVPYTDLFTATALYHALLASLPQTQRPAVFPNYGTPAVDDRLFTWATYTTIAVTALILSGLLRLAAYANLGPSFTFHLTSPPGGPVTTGLHAYMRHPSYTAIIVNIVSMVALLFRSCGVVRCWVGLYPGDQGPGQVVLLGKVLEVGMVGWAGLILPAWFTRRMREEEMLAGWFGTEWVECCRRTRRFVPGVF